MPRFGLKLGIHEKNLAVVAETLHLRKQYDFLELYVPRAAKPDHADFWRWHDGVLVLHAPHALGGFNFARGEMAADNGRVLELLEALREKMNPAMIVFHPGLDGDIEETFLQVDALRRGHPDLHRVMLLENKPRVGLRGEKCLGIWSGFAQQEVMLILDTTTTKTGAAAYRFR